MTLPTEAEIIARAEQITEKYFCPAINQANSAGFNAAEILAALLLASYAAHRLITPYGIRADREEHFQESQRCIIDKFEAPTRPETLN